MRSDQIQIRGFVRPCRTFGGTLSLFAKGRKKYVVIATKVPLWQKRAQVYDFQNMFCLDRERGIFCAPVSAFWVRITFIEFTSYSSLKIKIASTVSAYNHEKALMIFQCYHLRVI